MGPRVGVLVGALVASACASAPKMNVSAPIEKESAFLGTSYEQRGEPIDRGDMIEKLEQEPEASEELSGAGAFSAIAVLSAAVGGALIGWPIGEAVAGNDDPKWVLAAVGGGFVAISIPFAIVADNKVENAVDAHNRRVGAAKP